MKLKKYIIITVIIIEFLIIITGFVHFKKQPSILVIDIFGDLVGPDYPYNDTTIISAQSIIDILNEYEKKNYIKGFILNIDSTGGDTTGSTILTEKIQSMKKPVIAVISENALSGGYEVATSTKRIFANELSNIADIGITQIVGYKLNNDYRECHISTSNIKIMYYDDCPGLNPTYYQEDKLTLFKEKEKMVNDIARFRNLSNSYLNEYSDGTIFKGNEALTLKLIDEIGGIHEAKDWLENELGVKLEIVYFREVDRNE